MLNKGLNIYKHDEPGLGRVRIHEFEIDVKSIFLAKWVLNHPLNVERD